MAAAAERRGRGERRRCQENGEKKFLLFLKRQEKEEEDLGCHTGLAMCLAVPVFPGPSILVPRLASRVTPAVRADARDVMYPFIYRHLLPPLLLHTSVSPCSASSAPAATGASRRVSLNPQQPPPPPATLLRPPRPPPPQARPPRPPLRSQPSIGAHGGRGPALEPARLLRASRGAAGDSSRRPRGRCCVPLLASRLRGCGKPAACAELEPTPFVVASQRLRAAARGESWLFIPGRGTLECGGRS